MNYNEGDTCNFPQTMQAVKRLEKMCLLSQEDKSYTYLGDEQEP
jgi:hypothetical protein